MIITIGGLAGSGTTTAVEVLSRKLSIQFVSVGNIFRDMAKEKEMSLLEFSKFAEDNTTIDIELDKRQAKIVKESENLIVEGRLSAHLLEADLRIWLLAPLNIRAQRVCDRESKSMELAIEEITIRENSEALRYLDIYDINIHNFDIYDLVINTNRFNPDNIVEIILTTLKVI